MTVWSEWTVPNKKGISFREREIVREQKNGGKECGATDDTKAGLNIILFCIYDIT